VRFLIIFLATFLFAKNILILNSYSIKLPWTKGELEGILQKLNDRRDLKIFIEFMDTKYFQPTPKRVQNYYKYLKNKYKNIDFDIVLTTDDNALNFVREFKNKLFKNSKIFFAGVNNLKLANKLPKNTYAGVFEKKEPLINLDFAKKIVKNLKIVYVVGDNSNSAKAVFKEYKNAFKDIKDIEFIYINKKNLENVFKEIKNTSNSVIFLLTPYSFLYEGSHIGYKCAIKLLSHQYNYPIIIHTDLLANIKKSNIVGGKATDALTQGMVVGSKVLDFLDGKKMKDIGFTFEKANKMYLNVLNLKKFGVDAYSLNYKNPIYVNKPQSFFEIYKKWIIGFSAIFFAILVISAILIIKNIQLKKYNKKISKLNKELQEKFFNAISDLKQKEELLLHQTKYLAIGEMFLMTFLKIKKELSKDEISQKILNELQKIESFFKESYLKEFDLKKATKEVVNILPLNFKTQIKGDEVKIFGYENKFKQIVLDFLFNIKKFESQIDNLVIDFKDDKITIYIDFKTLSNTLKSEFNRILKNELYYTKAIMQHYFCKECKHFYKQNGVIIQIVL